MKHSTAGKTPDDTTFGSPALVRAAHAGKREMVELLLDNGADIEQRGGRGWTALAEAANAEHLEIVSLLAVRGADVNARFKSSWTALMWVAREGNLGAVKLLLEKGADPDLKSEHRITAITLANQMGRTEVVEFLLEWPFHVAEVAKKKAEVAAEELQVKRAAAHLEKLKSRRPKQSPFGRGKP
jgi:ankyrin repeat protein